MKHVYTDEEIRLRYISDLQALIAKERAEDLAEAIEHGLDKDSSIPIGISFFGEIFEAAVLTWPNINVACFEYPEGFGLSKAELEAFESSDVVWAFAQVALREGKLCVEVLLVDYYEGE